VSKYLKHWKNLNSLILDYNSENNLNLNNLRQDYHLCTITDLEEIGAIQLLEKCSMKKKRKIVCMYNRFFAKLKN